MLGAGQLLGTLRWDRPPALARAGGGFPRQHRPGFWRKSCSGRGAGCVSLEGPWPWSSRRLRDARNARRGCWGSESHPGDAAGAGGGDEPGMDPAGALPPPPTRLNHPAESGLCQDCPLSCCHQGLLWPCLRQHPWGWMEQQHKIKDKTTQKCDSLGIAACCFPAASLLEQRVTGTNSQGWRPQVLAVPSLCP